MFEPYLKYFFEKNTSLRFAVYCASVATVVFMMFSVSLPFYRLAFNQSFTNRFDLMAAASSIAPSIDGVAVNGPAVSLSPGVPIVMDASEPEPIKKAVADLQRDLGKVLGQPSAIVNTLAETNGQPAIVVSYQGVQTAQFRDSSLTTEEGHRVWGKTIDGVSYAVLQGADIRGSIYAVYTFSEKFVGVPALWYWSEWQPTVKSSLAIPANGGILVGSAQTRHRSWFLNNQDLWGSFNPSDDKYSVLFETMLRLKLNTFYIGEQLGEFGGSTLSQAQGANSRGLLLAANGLATFRQWDKYWTTIRGLPTAPMLSLSNQTKIEEYWNHSLQFAKDHDLDVLWVLGFRGRGDGGFWDDVAGSPSTNDARGDVVENQVRRQMELVRQSTGLSHPPMAFLIWNELSALMNAGALQPPADNDLIWIFGNDVRDHFADASARTYGLPSTQPFGFYMNLQFYSTGAHLVEAEGPWKAAQNFKLMQARRASGRLDFAELNMGNVREFLLTGTTTAQMMWNISNFNPDTSVQNFMSTYFGSAYASQLAVNYKSMINAYYQQKKADISGYSRQYIFQDLRIKEAMNNQLDGIVAKKTDWNLFNDERLRIVYADTGQNSEVGAVMIGSQNAASTYATLATNLLQQEQSITPAMRPFYRDVLRVPTEYLAKANSALYHVTRAYFKYSSDKPYAYCQLVEARVDVEGMQSALAIGHHGVFSTWYNSEDLVNITDILSRIDKAKASLPAASCSVPTPTPTPTPTPAPTPTPTPAPVLEAASYTSATGLKTSTVKDGKRTYIKTARTISLKSLSCYNCGSGSTIALYNASSSGTIGSKIGEAKTGITTSGWSSANLTASLGGGRYYVIQFTPVATPTYYGSIEVAQTDVSFLKYATVGAPTWKAGSWYIKLGYTK